MLRIALILESIVSLVAMCVYDGWEPLGAFVASLATLVALEWLSSRGEARNDNQRAIEARVTSLETLHAKMVELEQRINKETLKAIGR